MKLAPAFIGLAVFLPSVVLAQTAGLNPLVLLAQDESSDNPTATAAGTTASGLYGITNGTWAEALAACGCGTTAEYPSSYLAPASLQTAAAAALIQQNGLGDWLCTGCDAAFTSQVAAAGGPSAFNLNLSTDPADYASLDTSGGLADYLAANGAGAITPVVAVDETGQPVGAIAGTGAAVSAAGGVGGNAGNGTIASGASTAAVTAAGAGGSSFNPFTYLWNQYQAGVAQPLAGELAAVQAMIQGPLLALLSLAVIMMAIGAYAGRLVTEVFFNRLLRIAAVVGLTSIGSTYYNEYVVQFFGGLPTWISNGILGSTSNNPAAGFDVVLHNFASAVSNTWWNLPWGASTLFMDGPIIAVSFIIVVFATALMFTVWLIAQAILQLLIVMGPLLILAILFDHTRGWFDRWISAMMLMVFVTFTADLVSSLVLKVIIGAMNALPNLSGATEATQSVFNLVGIALVVFVLASAVAILPRVAQHIAAASGAPEMGHASRWLGGAASAATRGVGRAAGAVARGAGG